MALKLTEEERNRLRSILLRRPEVGLFGVAFLIDLLIAPDQDAQFVAWLKEEQEVLAAKKAALPAKRAEQDAAIAADEKLLAELTADQVLVTAEITK